MVSGYLRMVGKTRLCSFGTTMEARGCMEGEMYLLLYTFLPVGTYPWIPPAAVRQRSSFDVGFVYTPLKVTFCDLSM